MSDLQQTDLDHVVRILAPLGRDAELGRAALARRGIDAEIHLDIDSLCKGVTHGAGVLLLTQEALVLPRFPQLVHAIEQQPPWSDLPLVVLASRGLVASPLTHAMTLLDARTNATLLERPVRSATIIRAVESGLRTRKRQYELRDELEARVNAEAAERLARAEAEEALSAREEFLSIASHELRNPVAALNGTAQLLARAHASGRLTEARLETYLEALETGGRYLARLTEDLLDVSRAHRGELPLRVERIDLGRLVRELVRRGEWPEHRVALELPREAAEALIDPHRIGQVISNLLDNAIKYSPEGGVVSVRVRRADTGVLLEVVDEGIGLERDSLESIFKPFGRAANAREANIPGLGLGLYLSRRIAEQHGGRLWAESEGAGSGSVMSLWLPLEDGEDDAPGTGESGATSAPAAGISRTSPVAQQVTGD